MKGRAIDFGFRVRVTN